MLSLANGSTAVVVQVDEEVLANDNVVVTYNFEVDEHHTYFVGEQGVWVHNTGGWLCNRLVRTYYLAIAKGDDATAAMQKMKIHAAELAAKLKGVSKKEADEHFKHAQAKIAQNATEHADEAKFAKQYIKPKGVGGLVPRSKVDAALKSTSKETRLEGEVADHLFDDLQKFQHKIKRPNKPHEKFGEIDIEIPKAIIEVTTGIGQNKVKQTLKFVDQFLTNPNKKPFILFITGDILPARQKAIEAAGAYVVKSLDELDELLKRLY